MKSFLKTVTGKKEDTNQVEIEKLQSTYGKTNPKSDYANSVTIICPDNILNTFKDIIKQSGIPGTKYVNPYTGEEKKFPELKDLELYTPWHLQVLARNEVANTTGTMDVKLYHDLLTDNQIATIRALVKFTTVSGRVTVHQKGRKDKVPLDKKAYEHILLIDQAGLQWQNDFRNTGGLFFYPDIDIPLPDYQKWQQDTFKAVFGFDRPKEPSEFSIDVIWTTRLPNNQQARIKGKLDLNGVALAVELEFMQALTAAAIQGEKNFPDKKLIFKYLKAGMGFFAHGLIKDRIGLEIARLRGIANALQKIKNLPEGKRADVLKNIKAIELPFTCNTSEFSLDEIRNPSATFNTELKNIKILVEEMGLTWFGVEAVDALQTREGYVTAVTNTGDPHAMPGNEGNNASVDAMFAENVHLFILFALMNERMEVIMTPANELPLLDTKLELPNHPALPPNHPDVALPPDNPNKKVPELLSLEEVIDEKYNKDLGRAQKHEEMTIAKLLSNEMELYLGVSLYKVKPDQIKSMVNEYHETLMRIIITKENPWRNKKPEERNEQNRYKDPADGVTVGTSTVVKLDDTSGQPVITSNQMITNGPKGSGTQIELKITEVSSSSFFTSAVYQKELLVYDKATGRQITDPKEKQEEIARFLKNLPDTFLEMNIIRFVFSLISTSKYISLGGTHVLMDICKEFKIPYSEMSASDRISWNYDTKRLVIKDPAYKVELDPATDQLFLFKKGAKGYDEITTPAETTAAIKHFGKKFPIARTFDWILEAPAPSSVPTPRSTSSTS